MIKKAIITAGGLGSRLFPFTKHVNKLMLHLLNKPVVDYLVDELIKSGIKEIIITGSNLKEVKKYFASDRRLRKYTAIIGKVDALKKLGEITSPCKLIFHEQKKYYGWMYEILTVKRFIGKDDFAVAFSDVLYKSKIPATKQLINHFNKKRVNIASEGRFIFKNDIIKLIEKEKFYPGIEKIVERILEKLRTENDLVTVNIKGTFIHTGDILDYLKGITIFALSDKKIAKEYSQFLKEQLKNK